MREMLLKGSLYWAGMLAGWSLRYNDWKVWLCVGIAFIWYAVANAIIGDVS